MPIGEARPEPFDLAPDTTRQAALIRLRRDFAAAGIAEAALDARLLLLRALRIEPAELAARPEAPIGEPARVELLAWARRRWAGEPVGRILGERDFWGLPFRLGPDTLEPRPDTETVVELALALRADPPRMILDLGTGSGCLLVALLCEFPDAVGVGIDRSAGALAVARDNARRNGVGARALFAGGDWGRALAGGFDLLVSNPPYIVAADLARLPAEVARHDPRLALDGGDDGLDAYRRILADGRRLMAPGGQIVVEIGQGQDGQVIDLAGRQRLEFLRAAPDLSGIIRALAFRTDR